MNLVSISVSNFRNYRKREFGFGETTVVVGPNASGKTNLLEGIYLLATGDSFKAQKIEEMVKWNTEVGRVKGVVGQTLNPKLQISNESQITNTNDQNKIDLEVVLTKGMVGGERAQKRKLMVNGVGRRKKDFMGNLVVVVFRPEDLELVSGSPAVRRSYLDMVLVQVDQEYRRSLMAYEKALRRRNRLLDLIREGEVKRNVLAFWDQVLIKNGGVITEKRRSFLDFVNQEQRFDNQELSNFRVEYDFSAISEKRLNQYREEEVAAGYTLVGPHKDDIQIMTNNQFPNSKQGKKRDLAIYGSRGQQRLAVLWLKLMELEYIDNRLGQRPVLLLDDILSELDRDHQQMVMGLLGKQQTIMTTVGLPNIKKIKKAKVVQI